MRSANSYFSPYAAIRSAAQRASTGGRKKL